jgi:hypothetical protein
MKVCIIFRGDNVRDSPTRGFMNACNNIDNWKTTLFDNLIENNHSVDITFITYQSQYLENLCNIIKPKNVLIVEKTTQEDNFLKVLDFMKSNKELYDRFVILRFDFLYRKKILDWPKWNEKGIILVNRDVHWPTQKLYADVVFICDTSEISTLYEAFEQPNKVCLHHIGKNLYINNKPFHLMYEKYFGIWDHPLHAVTPMENSTIDLNIEYGKEITDLSMWN